MRILHLTDHYEPVLGGIETHVRGLAERQARMGHDVTVLTSTGPRADGRQSSDSGPVTVRRARRIPDRDFEDLLDTDVVHAHLSVVAPFTSPLAARAARRGVPTVVTVHSLWNGLGPVPAIAAQLAGLRGADVHWTAVSRVAAEQLAMRLPAGRRIDLLPNAVDLPPRRRTPEPGPDDRVRLATTMRVARRKRPLPLLRMFTQLVDLVNLPVELVLIGDGPLRPVLERHIRRSGLADTVHVTGRLEPSDVFAALSGADIYVAPAVLESFGLAALEARSIGLPVVGRAGSGLTEFLRHGVEGLLCDSDAHMVRVLERLVRRDDERFRMSEHNRTVAPLKTWANTLEAHEDVYERARPRSAVCRAAVARSDGRRW
jgi:glycosyltransferase involved in cell wall biosynthesis